MTDFLTEFPLYVPHSAGSASARTAITQQAIRATIPELCALGRDMSGGLSVQSIVEDETNKLGRALGVLFEAHGSDKAWHKYHYFYGPALTGAKAVLEIGLGTNNTDVVSNMGEHGRPGASLRAFRAFLPGAHIYGADIDQRILFEEDRISTFHVDQTNDAQLQQLLSSIPVPLDAIIDDGLHCPHANLTVLKHGLRRVRPGGWVIIEDIQPSAFPVWEVVYAMLRGFEVHMLSGRGGMIFAVKSTPRLMA